MKNKLDSESVEHYDRLWSQQWQAVQQIGPLTHTRYRLMLKELRGVLKPGARVLDVGCGTGRFLAEIAKREREVDLNGVEISEQAVRAAYGPIKEWIRNGDIVALADELSKEPYDAVICSEVLEHVDDPLEVAKALSKVLKIGATAVLTVPCGMRYWSAQDDVAGHKRRFELQEFAELLRAIGLEVEHLYAWGGPFSQLYNRLVSKRGPDKVMQSGAGVFNRLIARGLLLLFRIEDFFPSKQGFQIIARARKA